MTGKFHLLGMASLVMLTIPVVGFLQNPKPVVEACIKLSDQLVGNQSGSTPDRCRCFDKASRRFLDDRNYALLESASKRVVQGFTSTSDETLAAQVNEEPMDALDMASSAADFLLLAQKIPRVCK